MSAVGAISPPVASMHGELPSQKSIKDLEFELAEKDRCIKKLEMQMLAASDAKSICKATQDDESALRSSVKPCFGDNLCLEAQHPNDTRSLTSHELSLDGFAMGSDPAVLKAQRTLTEQALDVASVVVSRRKNDSQGYVNSRFDEKEMSTTCRVTSAKLGLVDSVAKPESFVQRRAAGANDEAFLLKRILEDVLLERERKDTELRILQNANSVDMLRQEYSSLMMEVKQLSEQKQVYIAKKHQLAEQLQEREAQSAELELRLSTSDAQGSPISSAHWRSKAVMLEEELKQKADVLTRLRQRELWFETQMARQAETNAMPLEALLNEVRALQDDSEMLPSKTTKSRGMPYNLRDLGKAEPSASERRLPKAPPSLPPQHVTPMISETSLPMHGESVLPTQYC